MAIAVAPEPLSPGRDTMIVRNDAARSVPGLTRVKVLGAALRLIDSGGLGALTMRRLGEDLGVEGMAVYHYVSGRDDLLDGVVDMMTAEVAAAALPAGSIDWQHYLHLIAAGFRGVLTTHPAAFPLLLTHPSSAGDWWLRAPLRDPAWHQAFLNTLQRCGFRAVDSGTAYRWFTSFLAGHLLLESASINADPLRDDPQAALRRAAEGQHDFDDSIAVLTSRLSLLQRGTA